MSQLESRSHSTPEITISTPTISGHRGLINRLAKHAVTTRLDQLCNGTITLHDSIAQTSHGSDADQRQALMHIHDPRFYREAVLGGGLGFAESYMAGDWDTPNLTELLRIFVRDIKVAHENDSGLAQLRKPLLRAGAFIKRNTLQGSRRNIAAHYDLGNEFFALFLDETMTYSSGVFESPQDTLYDASVNKLDRICRKLQLTPDDHVLETGTGWGSFAIHAAKNYGCRVTTTTISKRQHEIAKQRIEEAGLSDRVTLLLKDYRDLEGQFDKIVSIEMIEAVGHKYLETYLGACSRLLKDDGQMLIQVISMPDQRYKDYLKTTDFIQKHVFPGSCCPSINALSSAVTNATDMRWTQYEDFTYHYAMTLEHWRVRFEDRIDEVRALGYPEQFIRMWRYYLCYCEGGFLQRAISTVHLVSRKPRFQG